MLTREPTQAERRHLVNWALQFCRTIDDAHDMVQEALFKACRCKEQRYRPESRGLKVIIKRLCIDLGRSPWKSRQSDIVDVKTKIGEMKYVEGWDSVSTHDRDRHEYFDALAVCATLKPVDQRIVRLLATGETLDGVGLIIGESGQFVRNRVGRLRRKA